MKRLIHSQSQELPQVQIRKANINMVRNDDFNNEEIEEKKEGEIKENKHSLKKHEEIESKINFIEYKIKMYSTFKNYHSELFNYHHIYNINSIDNNTFTYYCQERKHNDKLEYYR